MKELLLGMTFWNHWQIGKRCLKSIKEHVDLTNIRFVIIDNHSTDEESLKWLENCGEEVIHLDDNYGCCGGIRHLMQKANEWGFEYAAPFCPDVLFTDGCINRLMDTIKSDDKILVVSPKDNNMFHRYQCFPILDSIKPAMIKLGDDKWNTHVFGDDLKLQEYIKTEFYAKRRHPAWIDCGSVDLPVSVWRLNLLNDLGGFNQEYDYALGDVEVFVKNRKFKQYKIVYCLSSFVYHHSHGASGLYEGYYQKFGKQLRDYADEKSKLIKSCFDIPCEDYGKKYLAFHSAVIETEKSLVRLEKGEN